MKKSTTSESFFSFFNRKPTNPETDNERKKLAGIVQSNTNNDQLSGEHAAGRGLSDSGQFAYVGFCAVCLYQLYPEENFNDFKKLCLNNIVKHIAQCKQVIESAHAIMEGRGDDSEAPFIEMLKTEKVIIEHGFGILINDLIIANIREGVYDARTRILAKHMARLSKVDWKTIEDFEELLVNVLLQNQHELTEDEKKEMKSKALKTKIKRVALISAATIGGGTLIGLTGGLAAPLIIGAVLGTGAAAALGVAGVAVIGSLFGVAGAGLTGYKMKKRVGDIEEFEFQPITSGQHLATTIAVSGWLTDDIQDFRYPWKNLIMTKEQYVLRYESKYLIQMGNAIDYLLSFAISAAAQNALSYTILSTLLAAVAWPATLVSAASIIDNPWGICTQRSVNVGRQLANVLISREQGKRPVSLIGFSLGARVIFFCLLELSKRKNCEGIIEDVVLLGAPVTASTKDWKAITKVVSGRIINGYCRKDWLLKFLYRTTNMQFNIAGLQRIDVQDRRMHNFDLTEIVDGHMDYMNKLDEILDTVNVPCKKSFKANIPQSISLPINLISSPKEFSINNTKKSRPLSRSFSMPNIVDSKLKVVPKSISRSFESLNNNV